MQAIRPPRLVSALLLSGLSLVGLEPVRAQSQTVGLFVNDSPHDGLVLFSPTSAHVTYLMNNDGLLVHSWTSEYTPGFMGYLQESGNLLRSAGIPKHPNFNGAPGAGGRVEQFAWDGTLLWIFKYADEDHHAHHDIEPLPNGNVLLIAWDYMSPQDAIAQGKIPAFAGDGQLIDSVVEIEPTPPVGANIVWEWHARDHLIQDFDPTKANWGIVEVHPELIDFNFGGSGKDWTHANGVDYNAELDQILVSVRALNEIWIIDHSTTTAEAAGHSGGTHGKGGDLLYRWGNPQAYRRGSATDQKLFGQHDPQWIPADRDGGGNIIVYNNGLGRPGPDYSSVDEIDPPADENGFYPVLELGEPFGPTELVWTYEADPPTSVYSYFMSGAERQPNGNTLICHAPIGHFVEVTQDADITWHYVNPVSPFPLQQGQSPDFNPVFKVRRYPFDYPGFVGHDLTPGDPVEGFDSPFPVPRGSLTVAKNSADGSNLEISWEAFTCPSSEYNLLHGSLASVSTYEIDGAECNIGISGAFTWTTPPSGSAYFLVVGTDITGVYESSWGVDSAGNERFDTKASFQCGATTKVVSATCP